MSGAFDIELVDVSARDGLQNEAGAAALSAADKVAFIRLLGVAQPLMAIDFALSGALRGAGDTRFPLLSTFCGLICGRVLLAAVFTWLALPVEWVYGTLLADYSIKVSLLVLRFRSGRWRHALLPRS